MILTPGRFFCLVRDPKFAYYNVGTWVSENVELLCWTSNWEPMCRRCYLVQWSSEIIFNITIIWMLMMMKVLNLPLPRCRLDRSLPRPCTHEFYSDIFFNACGSTIYPMLKNIVPPHLLKLETFQILSVRWRRSRSEGPLWEIWYYH